MSTPGLAGPPPALAGDGLLLGPWDVEGDVGQVLEMAVDEHTRAWTSMRAIHDEDDARAYMQRRTADPGRAEWAVRDPASGALLGRVNLHALHDEPRSAEIGYSVHPRHRRRGVAVAAVRLATAYGFDRLRLSRISLVHAAGNAGSCAVATASGYAFEGVERAALEHGDGVPHDTHRHARLAGDPPGRARPAPPPRTAPPLRRGRLLLRPWRDSDADALREIFRDPSLHRWHAELPRPADGDEAVARWLLDRTSRAVEGRLVSWAVDDTSVADRLADGAAGQLVAAGTLRGLDRADAAADASYWVRSERRGEGIAPRVLDTMASHGFDALGLHRVAVAHAVTNVASCRVAGKAGFAGEGVSRGSDRLGAAWVDEHVHARLADDPRPRALA